MQLIDQAWSINRHVAHGRRSTSLAASSASPALVDTAANRHARSSALCPRAAQEGHPNHSHLSCSQACPPDAVSHAPGLAACARQQQPGSLGRWRLLLHLAQGPAALHHLGAIPAALGSARRPVPTCSRRPVPDWGTTAHNAVDGATPHAHPNGAWGVTGVRRLLAPLGGLGRGWCGWPGRGGWVAWWVPVLT